MKHLLLLISVLFVLSSTNANATSEWHEFGRQDRVWHFSVSFAFGAGAATYYSNTWTACGAALIPGIAKEVYDEFDYGGWDNRDLIADAAGACLGAWMVHSYMKRKHSGRHHSYR